MTATILNFPTRVERAIKACPRIPRSWAHMCRGLVIKVDGKEVYAGNDPGSQVFTPMDQPCKCCGKEYRMNK